MEINYSVDLLRRDENERSHIRKELVLIQAEYDIKNCKVLELGCGLGQNLSLFRHDNAVVGIEGLSSAVAQARSRGLTVFQGDLEGKLDLETGTADWVLCLDVLEHLSNPLGLLLEMRRILRNGGRAIVNVPNHFDLSGRVKILLGHDLDVHRFFPQNHEWDNPHLRFFTHRGIRQLTKAAGFEVIEDRSSRIWLSMETSLRRLRRYLAQKSPAAFAPGFFLIIGKTAENAHGMV